MAIILYSLEGKTSVERYIANEVKIKSAGTSFINSEPTFVFSPFDAKDDTFFFTQLENAEKISDSELENCISTIDKDISSTTEEEFKLNVDRAVTEIKKGTLIKVCLSRVYGRPRGNKSLIKFVEALAKAYESSFVYLLSSEKTGTWLGVSPELLIKKSPTEDKYHFASLAGTQKKDPNTNDVSWNDKNIHEQKIVTDYIIDSLRKAGANNITVAEPKTIEQGPLLHIRTDIDANEPENKNFLSDALEKLHPTPAICGIPKEKAKSEIIKWESHKREYYSGFVGPVGINGEISIYVNIRCAQAVKEQILFYVGVGVVADSTPDLELEETNLKLEVLNQHWDTILG